MVVHLFQHVRTLPYGGLCFRNKVAELYYRFLLEQLKQSGLPQGKSVMARWGFQPRM